MCGIVGFINWSTTTQQAHKKWFQQALFVDTLRGSDGTGVAVLPEAPFNVNTEEKGLGMYKRALAAPDFLQLNRADNLMNDVARARFALGHNRAATQGDKTKDENSHPFQAGDITMVHNGTLTTRNGLSVYDTVDSKSICSELAITDPDDYAGVLANLDGAFTLIWYNSATRMVYMARNEERPLVMGSGNEGDTLFFASEQWMITQLLSRSAGSVLDIDDKNYYKTWSMPTQKLHAYPIDLRPISLKVPDSVTSFEGYVAPKIITPAYTPAATGGASHNAGGVVTNIVKFQPKSCPLKVGDYFYADHWTYTPKGVNVKRGTISGVSSEYPNIGFSVGNISKRKDAILEKEFNEWTEFNEKEELNEEYLREVLLEGTVTQITELRNGKSFMVQLKPSSLKVDCLETPIGDTVEGAEVEEPEKKPKPPVSWGSQVTRGTYRMPAGGYGSYNEWVEAVKDGCTYCKSAFIAHEHETIVWYSFQQGKISQYEAVCQDCAKHALN